jgi:hypothetical protein
LVGVEGFAGVVGLLGAGFAAGGFAPFPALVGVEGFAGVVGLLGAGFAAGGFVRSAASVGLPGFAAPGSRARDDVLVRLEVSMARSLYRVMVMAA